MENARGNKRVRAAAYAKAKVEKKKAKRERRGKRKDAEKKLGDKAPPKPVPRTIESTRVPDDTVVDPGDDEVAQDEATDELSEYFLGKPPKTLRTTSRKPVGATFRFSDELLAVFTDAEFHERRTWALKDMLKAATEQGFTDILLVNEDSKRPSTRGRARASPSPRAAPSCAHARLRVQTAACSRPCPTGRRPISAQQHQVPQGHQATCGLARSSPSLPARLRQRGAQNQAQGSSHRPSSC